MIIYLALQLHNLLLALFQLLLLVNKDTSGLVEHGLKLDRIQIHDDVDQFISCRRQHPSVELDFRAGVRRL
jgi:hypothetical protein